MHPARPVARIAPVPLALAALVGASGCDRTSSADSADVVTDSAGIRIVESHAIDTRDSPWTIDPEPLFRAGWTEGGVEFRTIWRGVIRDDAVIVADFGSNFVVRLPLDGGPPTMLGEAGEGPGEFGRVGTMLELGGDTLLVTDSGNTRVSVFTGDAFAYDRRYEAFVAEAIYEPVSRAADGTFLLGPSAFALRQQPDPGWRAYPLLATTDFVAMDTVGAVEMMHFGDDDDRNPINLRGIVTGSSAGFVYGRTDRPEVRWIDPAGAVTQIARWTPRPLEATDADRDAYEAWYRERVDPGNDPEAWERRLRDALDDFEGPMPAFSWLETDSQGNAWVGNHDFSAWVQRFDVFGPDGHWVARVELPRPARLLDVSDDAVLVYERDELDVQGVVLYRIDRSGG